MVNLDPKELSKFDSGNWWDEAQGPYAMLHRLNPIRLKFIETHVTLKNKKVADLGCGGGILTEALAKIGAQVTGLDLNETALMQAKTHAQAHQLTIDYYQEPIEVFANQHIAQFDVATCMEMLEHVPDPESIIAAAAALLKPGGYAFFSTINRSLRSYFEAILGAEYCLKLLPKGTHDYQKFIKPSELYEAAKKHQLTLVALNGLEYQLANKHFVLSKKPTTNYLAAFIKNPASLP